MRIPHTYIHVHNNMYTLRVYGVRGYQMNTYVHVHNMYTLRVYDVIHMYAYLTVIGDSNVCECIY